jgi:hypothetical protein
MSAHGRRWHALLALLLVLSGLPQGLLVVCVGENGHVAIEVAGAPARAAAATRAASAAPAIETAPCGCGDDCGPCHDSEIGTEGPLARLNSARGKSVAPPSTMSAMGIAPARPPGAGGAVSPAGPPGPSSSSGPSLLRSVVLRV